jgi:hypothetical protein
VAGGVAAGSSSQLLTNRLTGQPIDENLGASAVLGGLLGGIAPAIPSLAFQGPAPSYTWALNPTYFGPNSWRLLGQKFFTSILGGTINYLDNSLLRPTPATSK